MAATSSAPSVSSAPKVSNNANQAGSKISADTGANGQKPTGESKQGCCLFNCCLLLAVFNLALLLLAFASFGYFTGANFGVGWLTDEGGSSNCAATALDKNILNKINANKSIYQTAATRSGIPWEFLAGLHYRETNFGNTAANGDGPFQVQGAKNQTFGIEAAVEAAEKAKGLVKGSYGKTLDMNSDNETIKLAFLAYNRGVMYKRAGCTADQSPYVMNQFDAAHKNMRWPDNACEVVPPATIVKGKVENGRMGAFTIYAILKGNIAGSVACGQSPKNNTPVTGSGQCTWSVIKNDPPAQASTMGIANIKYWQYTGPNTPPVSKSRALVVNRHCTQTVENIFKQIYNSPDKPQISSIGCYEGPRKDKNGNIKQDTRHNWGAACDISYVQNYCWNCYSKKLNGVCTKGSAIGDFWKPGNIMPDKNYRGWSVGFDIRSIPINSTIANAFFSAGWGRGNYTCFEDYMHFSVDGH